MKTAARLWRCLEALTAQAGVIADWRLELGAEFRAASAFLRPTAGQGSEYPCVNRFPCGFRHRVVFHSAQSIVAVCDETDCPTLRLHPTDVVVMELNLRLLGATVARLLGIEARDGGGFNGAIRAEQIGVDGPLRSPVYLLVPAERGELSRRVEALMAVQPAPFMLVTPTARQVTGDLEAALARHGCVHLALDGVVAPGPDGRLVAVGSIEPVRAEFGRLLTEGRGLVKTVERMDRNLEAVARREYELTAENDELRRLKAGGAFEFAVRVDAEDFRAFATIMALGNRKAAADFLKVPHRSLYNRVARWASRGKDYQRLVRWIEWRKASSRTIKLRLEDSVQSGEPNDEPENPETVEDVLETISAGDNRDYPTILAQVMETLKTQNAKNWLAVRDELVDMIKEEVVQ